MLVTNITYRNNSYPNITPLESFAWGVIGDSINFECDLDLMTAAGAIDFFFNLIPNSKSPYNNPTNFEITQDIFKNLHSQTIQVFKGKLPTINGNSTTLTPSNPNNFFSGAFSVLAVNVATQQYKIQGTFIILPLVRAIDIDNDTFAIPSYFAGGESLKGVFKINTTVSDLNATVVESTDTINTTSLYKNGNIGYYNERLNGQIADFSLQPNSTVWQNGLTNLDSSQICKVTFQIKKTSGSHLTSSAVRIRATTPNDTFGNDSYLTTQNFDEVLLTANGTVGNGINSKLVTCKATVNGIDNTLLDIEVSFSIGSYTSVALWVQISENTTTATFSNYNSNNVWVIFTQESSQVVNPVDLQKLGNAIGKLSFLYHYSDDVINQSFNHLVSFVGDWQQGLTKIVPKNGSVIEQIAIQIKRQSGAILDNIGTYNTTNLPIAITRGFNLLNTVAGGSYRQQIAIQKVGNNIECKFGFKILPDWFAFTDIVAAVIVRGTQRGLPFEIEFQTPKSVLQTYEETLNTVSEPRALGYTIPNTSKQIFINGEEVDEIIKGEQNLLRFYFRDDNLNDLQAVLSDLVAYFTVNYKNEGFTTQHSIHSEWDINPNSPFKEVAGHTAGRVKITIISIKEAFIECILDANKLVSIFGEQKEYTITGRLDRKNPPQYLEVHLLHLRGNNGGNANFRPFIEFTTGFNYFECEEVLENSIVANSLLYKYSEDLVPNWDSIIAVDTATLQDLVNGASGAFKVMPFPIITSGLSECTLQFRVAMPGIAPTNSWSYNFNLATSIDTVIGFKEKIQITSLAFASANTYYSIRTDPNLAFPQAEVFNLATINAFIAALNVPYEIQIINTPNNTLTLNYNYL